MVPESAKATSDRHVRILSGVQASGRLHVGNYYGALRQFIELQNDGEAAGTCAGHPQASRRRVPEFAAVVPVSTRLRTAKQESSFYERRQSISASRKEKEEELSGRKLGALKEIEDKLNRTMRKIVSSVFGELRKSPHIRLGESNYTYEVFEDTGTGTAYTSLIVLDLAVYGLTQLPFLIHDSLLFKNIENKAVSNLLNLYNAGAKQCFIAIDEIGKYGDASAAMLRKQAVIQLDDDNVCM